MPAMPSTLASGAMPPTVPPKQAPGGFADDAEPDGGKGDEPEVSAPGHLVLSDDRLEWLVERAEMRIAEVGREQGRELSGVIIPDSWMAERDRNQKSYAKDLEWRRAMPGTIFAEGMNLTFGDNARKCRLLSARVRDDLMGTRPFFGCMTGRNGNPTLTKQVETYMQDRIELSNVPETIREGIRTALIINEAVIKTTYKRDVTKFVGPAKGVFVYANGQPVTVIEENGVVVRPIKGKYVYENDDVIPDPNTEGLMRLVKDPGFAFTKGQYGLADFDSLAQEMVHYDGAESVVVDFRDFGCPLKVNSIHEADINFHLYHRTPEQLGYDYGDVEQAMDYFGWRAELRVGATQPIEIRGEKEEPRSQVLGSILIAEVYIRCDADEDGQEEEIMLILDVDNHRAIFYDYLGNLMSKRPFAVIPGIEKVAGRWYGIGVFSKMAHPEMYSDAQLNRINKKDSRVASATFRYRQAVTQWKDGAPAVLGTDQIFDIEPTWDPSKPPIFRVDLMENAELGMELMREMRQASDNEFGVQSAAAASTLDQNRSDTATGINDTRRDTDLLSKDQEYDQARAIEKVLDQAVEMELSNMDETVVAYSKDGSELATLNRSEIRCLERQVKLLLTKSRSAAMLMSNQAARAAWLQYMRLSPREQYFGRSFYLNELKMLECDDADEILPEVTKEEMLAWVKAQSQQKPPDKPVSESIAIKLTDLTPDERAQALAKANIQASPPQVIDAEAAKKAALDRAEKAPFPESNPKPNPPQKPPN